MTDTEALCIKVPYEQTETVSGIILSYVTSFLPAALSRCKLVIENVSLYYETDSNRFWVIDLVFKPNDSTAGTFYSTEIKLVLELNKDYYYLCLIKGSDQSNIAINFRLNKLETLPDLSKQVNFALNDLFVDFNRICKQQGEDKID